MEYTSAYFNELVMNRRSVFPQQFDTTRKVPDGIIQQMVINATRVPNHGQAEPWFFKVYTGKGLQTFAQIQSDLYKEGAGDSFGGIPNCRCHLLTVVGGDNGHS